MLSEIRHARCKIRRGESRSDRDRQTQAVTRWQWIWHWQTQQPTSRCMASLHTPSTPPARSFRELTNDNSRTLGPGTAPPGLVVHRKSKCGLTPASRTQPCGNACCASERPSPIRAFIGSWCISRVMPTPKSPGSSRRLQNQVRLADSPCQNQPVRFPCLAAGYYPP